MLVEVAAGYNGLKEMVGLVKGLNATNTQVAINEVKIALTEKIMTAQAALLTASEQQAAAAERIRELEKEVAQLKSRKSERERYQLQEIWRGAVAYVPKPGMENDEPAHWLCATCFDQGRKSYLVFKGQDRRPGGGNGNESTYACDACKSSMKVLYNVTPAKLRNQTSQEIADAESKPERRPQIQREESSWIRARRGDYD